MSETLPTKPLDKLAYFIRRWIHRVVFARKWLTFLVMGVGFFAFGAGTVNLFFLLNANGNYLLTYGWLAIMEGGLQQLLEILITGYASMLAYVVFKACEHRLTHWLALE